jgi:hypothetical protein
LKEIKVKIAHRVKLLPQRGYQVPSKAGMMIGQVQIDVCTFARLVLNVIDIHKKLHQGYNAILVSKNLYTMIHIIKGTSSLDDIDCMKTYESRYECCIVLMKMVV